MARARKPVRKKDNQKYMKYLSLVLLIVVIIIAIPTYNRLSDVWVQKEFAESLEEAGAIIPTGAVVLASPENNELIEYYAKKDAFLKDDEEDWKKASVLFLSESLPKIKGNNLFIIATIYDLKAVEEFNKHKQLGEIRPPVVTGNKLILGLEEEGLSYTYHDNKTNSTIILENDDDGFLQSARVVFGDGTEVSPKYLIDYEENKLIDEQGEGCLYQNNYLIYFDEKLCNTLLVKMLTAQKIEGLQLVYEQPWMKVYKVT